MVSVRSRKFGAALMSGCLLVYRRDLSFAAGQDVLSLRVALFVWTFLVPDGRAGSLRRWIPTPPCRVQTSIACCPALMIPIRQTSIVLPPASTSSRSTAASPAPRARNAKRDEHFHF